MRFTLPLLTGQREDIDSRVAPDGTLLAVKELVTRRKGRWEKRNAYVELTSTTALPTLAGEVWNLGSFNGDRLVFYDQPPRLAQHDPATDTIAADGQIIAPAFNAPQRYDIPHALGDTNDDLQFADVVYVNGFTVALFRLNTTWRVAIYNEATTQLLDLSDGITVTASAPAMITKAGNYAIVVFNTGSSELSGRVINCSGSSVPTVASAVVMTSSLASSSGWGISNYRGTSYFLLTYWSSLATSQEAEIEVWDPTNLAGGAVDSATGIALAAETTATGALAVDGESGNGVMLAARIEGSGSDHTCFVHYNDALDTASASVADASTSATHFGYPGLLMQSSGTTWYLVIGDRDTGGVATVTSTVNYEITTSGSAGSAETHVDCFPVSKPFSVDESDGTVRPYVVAVGDSGTAASGSPEWGANYYLLALEDNSFRNHMNGLRPQGFFGRDEALQVSSSAYGHPKVETTTGGEMVFAWRVIATGTIFERTNGYNDARLGAALWRWGTQTRDRFDVVKLGNAAYVSGGIMTRWNGIGLTEAGFLRRPDIMSLVASSSGSLTAGAVYSYIAVYESVTNDGEVVRSEPSTPATVTLGASEDEVVVTLRDNKLRSEAEYLDNPVTRIYLYRTIADQPGVYYMVMPQDSPILGEEFNDSTAVTYNDTQSDVAISARPGIYSAADASGLLPNATPPPCRFLARVGKRLICGGIENPNQAWLSAEHVEGEQVNFKDDAAFKVTLEEPITAVGELDGYPVVFTASSVHILLGPGPDDTGVGVFEVRQIPTDLGAVSHHVLTTDEGLIYQSERGIELLPRGFSPPQWIGAPVADTLGLATITSIVAVGGDDVRITFSGGVMVYNTTWGAWSVFELGDIKSASVWGGYHAVGYDSYDESVAIALETPGTPTTYIDGSWETNDLRMGALAGYGRTHELIVPVVYQGQSQVAIEVSYDSGQSWTTPVTYDLDSGTYTAGDEVPISLQLRQQKNDKFRFRISDTGYEGGSTGTDGVQFIGLELDWDKKNRPLRPVRAGLRG